LALKVRFVIRDQDHLYLLYDKNDNFRHFLKTLTALYTNIFVKKVKKGLPTQGLKKQSSFHPISSMVPMVSGNKLETENEYEKMLV
jgi:hypothetical protein